MLLYQKSFGVHFPASFTLLYFERSVLFKIFVLSEEIKRIFFLMIISVVPVDSKCGHFQSGNSK